MSYDIELTDPVTGEAMRFDRPHHLRGGTYQVGGSREAALNVTYNYSPHFKSIGEHGIRTIYGMTGADSIPVLSRAAAALDNDVTDNYWEPTEGNAQNALLQLIALATFCPDGVWSGD